MNEETDAETVVAEASEPKAEVYDLHIRVPAEMEQTLKECAELAYEMGEIPKPTLTNLMDLLVGWGLAVLKKKWLDRSGYH